jgi:predicted O-methyltransferase YrrM
MRKFNIEINTDDSVEKSDIEKVFKNTTFINSFYVDERKKINNKIVIYMHLTDVNEHHERINREIIQRVIDSGLINHAHLKLFCHYSRENFEWLQRVLSEFQNIEFFYPNVTNSEYEAPTLNKMLTDCIDLSEEKFILYMHSKGITRPTSKPVNDWRRLLLHFNVDRWEDNVALLNYGYDTVGVNLLENPLYYDGNFWWSKSSYVKRLKPIPRFVNRGYAELWVCSAGPSACEVFNSKVNHYVEEYPESNYTLMWRHSVKEGENMVVAKPGVSGSQIPHLLDRNLELIGIEIGCAFGASTEYFLSELKGVLNGIDPYENYVDWNSDVLDDNVNSSNYRRMIERVTSFRDRFILHKQFSDDAVNNFEDNSIDYIFIDGLHTYEQVLKDCINYYPKLKPGGLFSGHDYFVIESVRKAVDKFAYMVGAEVKTGMNDIWYWFKEEKTP